jgi:hypothetical protein
MRCFFAADTGSVVRLSDVLRETGFAGRVVATLREAHAALLHETPDVALVDDDILDSAGVAFLESSQFGDVIELLLITADPKLSSAVHGMQIGASGGAARGTAPGRPGATAGSGHQSRGAVQAEATGSAVAEIFTPRAEIISPARRSPGTRNAPIAHCPALACPLHEYH